MKTTLKISLGLFALLCLSALAAPVYAADEEDTVTLKHGERERTYLLFAPPGYSKETSYPLVIALHGGGGNARASEKMTGLRQETARRQMFLIHPNGTGRLSNHLLTWNAGNCCGYAHKNLVDDVGFIRAMIAEVKRKYSIDPKRVYVTGMSNGAKMSYRLACQLSDVIAAIAPVAGSMEEPDCKPKHPVSVLAINGTADDRILYEGGAPKKSIEKGVVRVDNSVASAISFWAKNNRCVGAPIRSGSGNVVKDSYTQCAEGTTVGVYSIIGGGHAWPGGEKIRGDADTPSKDLSASKEIVDFFLAHPRK